MTPSKTLVLCIEDELSIQRFLKTALTSHDFECVFAGTGQEGLAQAASRNPVIILLDLGLPDMEGLEVTRRLREWTKAPIIVLSVRGKEEDKIAALDAGADDYLTKPFSVGELLARLRVALRHMNDKAGGEEAVFRERELSVDYSKRRVLLANKEIRLTPHEYDLLRILALNAGKVVTHRQLLRQVWGGAYEEQTHTLRVHLGNLRHKLEKNPARPQYLLNEPGVGYRLAME